LLRSSLEALSLLLSGAPLYHRWMMPASVADHSDTPVHRHTSFSRPLPARNASDKPSLGREYEEKLPNGHAFSMNGKVPNGTFVMQSVPNNGRPAQPVNIDKSTLRNEGLGGANRTSGTALGSSLNSSESRGNSSEQPVRDDGYFASVFRSEQQDGRGSTQVKLGALDANESRKEAQKDLVVPAKDRSSAELTSSQPVDTSLQVPNARVSSPPAFNHTSPASVPQPYRLPHRHTLEVPKVSANRARELQASHHPTDDVVTASGRFSPNTPTRRRGSMSLARRTTRSIHSDMHLEEVPQDEDAARWADHIRQKRASKRKRKDDEDDDRVVVGTKVDQNHVNWVTAYNMLTGIRFTVSRTNAKMDRELTDADFEAKHKFSFDM
jgi:1-phosphatidylinositol-4-phosphate 5-kinase